MSLVDAMRDIWNPSRLVWRIRIILKRPRRDPKCPGNVYSELQLEQRSGVVVAPTRSVGATGKGDGISDGSFLGYGRT